VTAHDASFPVTRTFGDKDSSIRGRVGSVKKRLSHLGLGSRWRAGHAVGDGIVEEGEE